MGKIINLAGERFGRLFVIGLDGIRNNRTFWKCKCDCGKETVSPGDCLRRGETKSCGCYSKDLKTKHGHAESQKRSPEYMAWTNMLSGHKEGSKRSLTVKKEKVVCERWRASFENFITDMGPRPTIEHEILLINNAGVYEPSNCRWGTRMEMMRRSRIRIDNKTGKKGVWKRPNGKYSVAIHIKSKKITVGTFDTLEMAVYARGKAEEHYWDNPLDPTDQQKKVTDLLAEQA